MKKNFLIAIVVIIAIASVSVIYATTQNSNSDIHHAEYVVNSAHDDARTFAAQNSETGYGNEDGQWANLQLSPSYSFGVRFTNISIPRYALIKTAYIELYSIGTTNHRHPVCRIYCDDVDNAVNFSSVGVLDICGRVYTSKYSEWNTTVAFAQWVSTPSLIAPMQQVIDRQNWNPGNAIAFLFVSKGTLDCAAAFQNYENGQPAKLYVEWEVIKPK